VENSKGLNNTETNASNNVITQTLVEELNEVTIMQEDIEDNKPHLCVPTLDGNAHVIPNVGDNAGDEIPRYTSYIS
jgi:hypothetical protein